MKVNIPKGSTAKKSTYSPEPPSDSASGGSRSIGPETDSNGYTKIVLNSPIPLEPIVVPYAAPSRMGTGVGMGDGTGTVHNTQVLRLSHTAQMPRISRLHEEVSVPSARRPSAGRATVGVSRPGAGGARRPGEYLQILAKTRGDFVLDPANDSCGIDVSTGGDWSPDHSTASKSERHLGVDSKFSSMRGSSTSDLY